MRRKSITRHIDQLFRTNGDSDYGGEVVTQLEHALQCALWAEKDLASVPQIVASLLHDIGHLLHQLPSDAPEHGVDDHHENSGYRFLCKHFGADVTEPVKLHVDAKRYLCSVDPEYQSKLSDPSIVSLNLQGGLMSEQQVEEFQSHRYWQQAIQLRKWDDLAKDIDQVTPPLEHFLDYVDLLASE